jgi:gamma-glutamyltranspeptidase / glutathione hydrolase
MKLQFVVSLCAIVFGTVSGLSAGPSGEHGAVATVSSYATDAALAAMRNGGNAVDAAVAAALTLGVTDGFNSGIGGGCFLLIRTERGAVVAIDGRETAPKKATRDMFLREGKAAPDLSLTGALAIGVPGSLGAYEYALRHFGKLKLREHLLAAAKIAEEGFVLSRTYAERLAEVRDELARFPEAKTVFLKASSEPYQDGDVLKQPDLARSYRAIAEKGIGWFYGGEFARSLEKWMQTNGGLLTAEDFSNYRIALREPIRSRYRDYEIIGFPPPSSGGVHVAQILNILANFDIHSYPPYSANSIHLIAEAMKLAFADRAFWLGDPDFVSVPRGLISRNYADSLARRISLERATKVSAHGDAEAFGAGALGKHTTHFSTADADGNWVACTATVNTTFGSKVIVPGTGVIMNNQMDDFSAQPGVPNFFGLVGAEANAIAPGKRPLSSMSPTIVLKAGRPMLSLGAAGGPTIISQTVVNLVNILDYGMSIEEALAKPRIHHQWKPDELRVENVGDETIAVLKAKGHDVKQVQSMGAAQIVIRTVDGFSAAADPRVVGKASVW